MSKPSSGIPNNNAASMARNALEAARVGTLKAARTPGGVVFLSMVLPGLGHIAAGKYLRGLIFAVPSIAVALVLLLIALFDRSALYQILAPKTLMSLFLVDMIALAYHVWAMVDAYQLVAPRRSKGRVTRTGAKYASQGILTVLLVCTVGVHAGLAWIDIQVQQDLNCILNANGPCIPDAPSGYIPSFDWSNQDSFEPLQTGSDTPDPTPTPTYSPDFGASPTPTPGDTTAYPLPAPCTGGADQWAQHNCTLYILMIGGDAGIGRGNNGDGKPINLRTDTMILLQVDLSTGRSAMYGIPRNLLNVPLGQAAYNAYKYHFFPALRAFGADPRLGCGTATNNCMFNAMWVDAAFVNPKKYPYSGNYFAVGTKAVEDSVSSLFGVHVSGTVVVDLTGFVFLFNSLFPSGLTINSPYEVKQIAGTPYTDSNNKHLYGLDFPKGKQTLKGEMLLAYARLRHVVGHDSDYFRMSRQQLVITATLNQLNVCQAATNVTSIVDAAKGTIWSDLNLSDAPGLAAIATKIKPGNVRTYTLSPSAGFSYNIIDFNKDGSQNNTVWNKYKNRVQTGLNGVQSAYPSGGGGGGGGGFHC